MLQSGEDGQSGCQGLHHHAKPVASQKHTKSAGDSHFLMGIYVGICRSQSVEICGNGTHFGVARKRR